ncbi:DNA internalization-related competence protein ComEC/Rec2 [Undibacterium sp. Di26W]|uniref:DNA internalization-related competence protein ComEC/Rec2 n=1 Tax=Undibacterium sp. Di26W TaxID=3413035 RepID=UPI003BF3CBBA
MLGLVVGVALLQQQARLLSWTSLLIVAGVSTCACMLSYRFSSSERLRLPARTSLAVVLGFVWASGFAQVYLSESLPVEWENKDIVLIGTVDSLPFRFEQGVRFNFAVEQVITDGMADHKDWPSKLTLSWYGSERGMDRSAGQNTGQSAAQSVGHGVDHNADSDGQDADSNAAGKAADIQPGERWQLRVRLKRPHGNANPYGFDYEAWLLEQRLRATGTVRPETQVVKNRRLDAFVWSVGNVIELWRARLRDRIHAALPDHPYAGVLVALVVGDQREIPQSDWTVFNRAGIGHLISISGLHITMVAGLFATLIYYLWRHSFFFSMATPLPLRLPAQKAAALAGAAMALLYVALAGFGVPAQRTMFMLIVVALAVWHGRISQFSSILCLALGSVVVLDPWAVLSPGFWLSFSAVAMIVFASDGYLHQKQAEQDTTALRKTLFETLPDVLRTAGLTQYAVTVGLVPLTMLLFGQISLISPLANAIAIPLVSFIVTPLALLGSVMPAPLSAWLLRLAHVFVDLLARLLTYLSAYPLAVWNAPLPSFWMFCLAMLGAVWLLAPRGWPMRWLGVLCCLPLFFQTPATPAEGELQVTALDIGQGMALLLETSQHRLLYDTGPTYSPESDSGSRVILPYLHARGINKLDGMMVSHNDSDHSGGALTILKQLPVDVVRSSLHLDSPIVQAASKHQRCEAGQQWDWDGVHFEILQPVSASYDSNKWKPNARSCVLRVSTARYSMLLPGDIEAIQEDELVNMIPQKLPADVLLAPHHGSGTSSTPAFLRAVHPALAVFQVGYLNRYHHPKTEVYARYADFGIKRLRSDESGAITLQFGASLTTSQFRQENARYWFDR